MQRDHYEGTIFDLTQGIAAGAVSIEFYSFRSDCRLHKLSLSVHLPLPLALSILIHNATLNGVPPKVAPAVLVTAQGQCPHPLGPGAGHIVWGGTAQTGSFCRSVPGAGRRTATSRLHSPSRAWPRRYHSQKGSNCRHNIFSYKIHS